MKNQFFTHFKWLYKPSYCFLCWCLLAVTVQAQQKQPLTSNVAADEQLKAKAKQWLKDDRTGFTENKGQLKDQDGKPNPAVKYLLNMQGLNVQLRTTGFSYDTWVNEIVKREKDASLSKLPALPGADNAWMNEKRTRKFHRVDIELQGANPQAQMVTELPLPTAVTVMDGQETYAGIHSYKKITYKEIYPGIDLEFLAKKGTDKPVEYNFIVHPGADASLIKMQYAGANNIKLQDGQIEMNLAFCTLKEKIPASFIEQTGQNLAVQYKADEDAEGLYAFEVPDYDKSQTLIIDPTPTLIWATYLGGTENAINYGYDEISAIKADNQGNIVVAGTTSASTGIATAGTYQPTYISPLGAGNGYAVKYTAAGVKIWGTYVHGNTNDLVSSLTVDNSNNIYLSMWTGSNNLQVSAGVHQTTFAGSGSDGYIIKFSPAGTYVWATYLGSVGEEIPYVINMLPDGNLIIGGYTSGGGAKLAFGTGFDQTLSGTHDCFIVKMNAVSGVGIWGTLIGGPSESENCLGVVGDALGNIYFAANTNSTTGIATAGAFQTSYGGGLIDGVIGKLNSNGSTLSWCTYYGGSGYDALFDIKLDNDNNPVVFGVSDSQGLGTPGTYQANKAGDFDGLIAKFSPTGARIWGSYFGGTGYEIIHNGAIDENNNIYITGYTGSLSGVATNCSFQPVFGGGTNDCYIAKLTANGSSRIWGTYFGGSGVDQNNGTSNDSDPLAYAGNGVLYMAGLTLSAGLATGGAADASLGGVRDGFIAKFSEGTAPADLQVTAQTIAPPTQSACALGIPNTITGNLISIFNPATFTSPIFYQWQVADASAGPWANLPGEVFKDLTPLAANNNKYYRRQVLVNDGFCDKKVVSTSSVSEVAVTGNSAPIANANGPQWFLCGSPNTITLNGSASGGSGVFTSYQWFAGSNFTTPVATTQSFTPTNITASTTYTLKVTDNAGCTDLDQATITPVVADAGRDTLLCQGSGGIQLGKPGAAGGAVLYTWTRISGDPISTLSCTACAQPVANPFTAATPTVYRLTVTVTRKDGTTCNSFDDVSVGFVQAPTNGPLFAGPDVTICKTATATLGAGTADAAATYSWAPGNYLSNVNIARPVFNAGIAQLSCPLTYSVTALKAGCTFSDQVQVSVINPSVDYENQTIPCYAFSEQLNEQNCGGATYNWITTAPGKVPTVADNTLRDGGASAIVYNPGTTNATFRRTTTLNGVTCNSGLITVMPCGVGCPPIQIKVVGKQGCPKKFPGKDLQLYVKDIDPNYWSFSWTPVNVVDNPTAPVVSITSGSPVSINVVLTNKITGLVCTTISFPINDPSWVLPPINTPDRSICANVATGIGEANQAGYSYEWTPITGLTNPTSSNPLATLSSGTSFTVLKTDAFTGCAVEDEVEVTVGEIEFDAGADRTICNGATVTLGTNAPAGSNYTYTWAPAGAAYTNGTGPNSANPQVLFAGSTQTFTVTITDPVSGCTKTDNVTLKGGVTPGEYAGIGVGPLCPGSTTQLGRAAENGATYLWSPAAGLSCTNCSNPTLTVGTSNQTYTLAISYPGCSTPVSDQVTVTVKPVPTVVFTDKASCPSTPINIGVGGTGNSATIAGVASYSWAPATGLSCATCASPMANPQATTTYTATITLTNGCIITDEVTVTPSVTATAKPDATVCPGGSVQLGSPAQANVTYAWSPGTGLSCTNCAQPIATPAVTTTYTLTATGTGPNAGCTVTDEVLLTVKALPAFTITGNSSICVGGIATLSASPVTQNLLYQWSPVAGVVSPTSATTQIMPTATTTYRLTRSDLVSGCSDFKEIIVSVLPNNVTATGGSITVCPNTSGVLPLTITPATGNTVSWLPATYLSNPFLQNPTVTPPASGNYIATVTNTTTNCSDTALVVVTVPANCNGSDFGDAPTVYEAGSPASHAVVNTLKIGTSIDAEGAAVNSSLANGDDLNQVANDEQGITFLPTINTATTTVGLLVNSVLNNTGSTAYLVGWVDFNRDGDFSDAGERSGIVAIASSTATASQTLQFTNFNTTCNITVDAMYMRLRLTTDTTGGWNTAPSPTGARSNGEVEDYYLPFTSSDFGDLSGTWPIASALIATCQFSGAAPALFDNTTNPSVAVWAGVGVNMEIATVGGGNLLASTDSYDDGLGIPSTPINGGYTYPFTVTMNANRSGTTVYYRLWFDWNNDGNFSNDSSIQVGGTALVPATYADSAITASPVTVTVLVKPPFGASANYKVRLVVTDAANTVGGIVPDFYRNGIGGTVTANAVIGLSNGEVEDYNAPAIILPLNLTKFEANNAGCAATLHWTTAFEQNTARFEIEQSTDGRTWTMLASVTAAGNAPTGKSYTASVSLKEGVTNYLRLKMIDKNGLFTHSATRLLRCDGKKPIIISPNPVKDQLLFSGLQGSSVLRLMNNVGQILLTTKTAAGTYTMNVSNLLPGIYIAEVIQDGKKAAVQKIVKQ